MAHTKAYCLFFYKRNTKVCNGGVAMCAMKVKNNTYHVSQSEEAEVSVCFLFLEQNLPKYFSALTQLDGEGHQGVMRKDFRMVNCKKGIQNTILDERLRDPQQLSPSTFTLDSRC